MTPRVSVVVRSYNRLAALAELLGELLAQDHDSFEIVVVEQSTRRLPAEVAVVEALARDPRVRVLPFPPLGGPGARNAGVRAARGELLMFIDDDDLPGSRDWLRLHEANFADPRCLGVTGRQLDEHGRADPKPYQSMARAYRQVLSFNALKYQRVFVCTDRRKIVESLHGSNVAIRRSALERFGLWDECTPIEDEPSFAYRMNAGKRADEYVVFDPLATLRRRLDVPGGMDKRQMSSATYGHRLFTFLHNIVAHYFPVRFVLLYPVYYVYVCYRIADWVVSYSRKHDTLAKKLLALAGIYLVLPVLWTGWLARWTLGRVRDGAPPHHPKLAPLAPLAAGEAAP